MLDFDLISQRHYLPLTTGAQHIRQFNLYFDTYTSTASIIHRSCSLLHRSARSYFWLSSGSTCDKQLSRMIKELRDGARMNQTCTS